MRDWVVVIVKLKDYSIIRKDIIKNIGITEFTKIDKPTWKERHILLRYSSDEYKVTRFIMGIQSCLGASLNYIICDKDGIIRRGG